MPATPDYIPEKLADALIDQIATGLARHGGEQMRRDFLGTLTTEERDYVRESRLRFAKRNK